MARIINSTLTLYTIEGLTDGLAVITLNGLDRYDLSKINDKEADRLYLTRRVPWLKPISEANNKRDPPQKTKVTPKKEEANVVTETNSSIEN